VGISTTTGALLQKGQTMTTKKKMKPKTILAKYFGMNIKTAKAELMGDAAPSKEDILEMARLAAVEMDVEVDE
jgi:hypothetical protein